MGRNIYVSPSGTARRVKALYVGTGSDVARRVIRAWVGDSNGIARLAYCDIPTNATLYGGYTEGGSFTYDGRTFSKNYGETSHNLTDLRLRNPSETIRVNYTSSWKNGYYDQVVTAGQATNLYACPEHTLYWHGIDGPNGFNYNAGDVVTTKYDNQFYIFRRDIYYTGVYSIYVQAVKNGTLNVRVSTLRNLVNPDYNRYYIRLGGLEYVASSNTTYSRNVSAGDWVDIGVGVYMTDTGFSAEFELVIDAIWFE